MLRAVSKAATPGKLPKDWQTEAESFIERTRGSRPAQTVRHQKARPDDKAFRKYFMHGVGHPLILDVHDLGLTTGPIQRGLGADRRASDSTSRTKGFAVRLENDILVGDNGNTDLMAKIPIEADDIEPMNR